VFCGGYWALDYNGDGICEPGTDKYLQWGQSFGIPVIGDWNGSGTTKIGSWANGQFVLDYNGDYVYSMDDKTFQWGNAGSTPVVGDWNGDGRAKVGVFNSGIWVLDVNGNGAWDQPSENPFQFGGGSVAQTPVPGRW
jgi:hypothetical protein